jgi:anti-sigma B factor antagonist
MTAPADPTGAAFQLDVESTGASPVLAVSGELDVATSPRLRATLNELIDAGATNVTLAFGGVTLVDSSGLGVLVGAFKRLHEAGDGSIRIVDARASVRKVFEITGLGSVLLDG